MSLVRIRSLRFGDPGVDRYIALEEDDARTVVNEGVVDGFDTLMFWYESEIFAIADDTDLYQISTDAALSILAEWGLLSDNEEWLDTPSDNWIVDLLTGFEP